MAPPAPRAATRIWYRMALLYFVAGTGLGVFMGVSQERGFLWHDISESDTAAPPGYEFSMEGPLRPDLLNPGLQGWLGVSELVSLVFGWVGRLKYGDGLDPDEVPAALIESGFMDRLE